jgi:prepilin-type processing-associated H-X9-DG protein
MVGERSSRKGFSTWVGVVHGAKYAVARIVGITLRPPNHKDEQFEDFGSHHPAGAQFVYCDGSVRMVYNNIDPSVFTALGSRDGKEVLDSY